VKKKMLQIILTVPHAQGCDSATSRHPCDALAEGLARYLQQSCKNAAIESEVLVGVTPRANLDLNRKESRNTEYRKQINERIQYHQQRGDVVWVIDCHSFPQDYQWTAQQTTDFVILDTWLNNRPTAYVTTLTNFLQKRKVHVTQLRGALPEDDETNDIMDTSRQLGAYSFLLEVKEGLETSTLQKMSVSLVAWLLTTRKDKQRS
jgi:predicted N-formylglutamate amidohydrolase